MQVLLRLPQLTCVVSGAMVARDEQVLTFSHAEASVAVLQHVLNAHVLHTLTHTFTDTLCQWCTLGFLAHSFQVATTGGKAHAACVWGVLMVAMGFS